MHIRACGAGPTWRALRISRCSRPFHAPRIDGDFPFQARSETRYQSYGDVFMQCKGSAILPVALSLGLAACGGGGSSSSGGTTTPAHQINGTISIEANTRVDADTADQLDTGSFTAVNNDTPQDVPSPVLLAGYLSDGSGQYPQESGDSLVFAYPADVKDQYRLKLSQDQGITWQVFPGRADNGVVKGSLVIAMARVRRLWSKRWIMPQRRAGYGTVARAPPPPVSIPSPSPSARAVLSVMCWGQSTGQQHAVRLARRAFCGQ